MFSTSADVLNIILSICVAVLTFFLCWAIYYFVASVQKIYKLVKRVENGVAKAEEILDMARNKLLDSSAYFMIFAEVAKKALEFVKDRQEKKRTNKK